MPEPTTPVVAAIVTAASGITMALFGFDYYAMLYGFVGALLALTQADPMGRWRSMFFVGLSTMIGAAGGNAAYDFLGQHARSVLILLCIFSGAGAQLLVATALKAAVNRLNKLGGQP